MTVFIKKASKTGRTADALAEILKAHDDLVNGFDKLTKVGTMNKLIAVKCKQFGFCLIRLGNP